MFAKLLTVLITVIVVFAALLLKGLPVAVLLRGTIAVFVFTGLCVLLNAAFEKD
jgi:hypothetical protein